MNGDSPQQPQTDLLLKVQGIHKRFGDHVVLESVDLDVPRGSFVTILGKSGTGKSVFLKCLANVMQPNGGRILFDGQLLDGSNAKGRAEFRSRCSFLFQSNALFDSLTVLENVALPLEQTTDLSDAEIRIRCVEALSQLELDRYLHSYPSQLSGGMQKRLALARAIVTKPELVLFDEPTAGLDPLRRNAVFEMIARYQRQFGFTAVIVTHDMQEALVASDRIALLDKGRMQFQGPPSEFTRSTDSMVVEFRDNLLALNHTLTAIRSGESITSADK